MHRFAIASLAIGAWIVVGFIITGPGVSSAPLFWRLGAALLWPLALG